MPIWRREKGCPNPEPVLSQPEKAALEQLTLPTEDVTINAPVIVIDEKKVKDGKSS